MYKFQCSSVHSQNNKLNLDFSPLLICTQDYTCCQLAAIFHCYISTEAWCGQPASLCRISLVFVIFYMVEMGLFAKRPKVVRISSAHLECPLTPSDLLLSFVLRYDVSALQMCTWKDAGPELKHSFIGLCQRQLPVSVRAAVRPLKNTDQVKVEPLGDSAAC